MIPRTFSPQNVKQDIFDDGGDDDDGDGDFATVNFT